MHNLSDCTPDFEQAAVPRPYLFGSIYTHMSFSRQPFTLCCLHDKTLCSLVTLSIALQSKSLSELYPSLQASVLMSALYTFLLSFCGSFPHTDQDIFILLYQDLIGLNWSQVARPFVQSQPTSCCAIVRTVAITALGYSFICVNYSEVTALACVSDRPHTDTGVATFEGTS